MNISYKSAETCKASEIAVGDTFKYNKYLYIKVVDTHGKFGFVNLSTNEFALMNDWNKNEYVQPVKAVLMVDCYE